MGQITVTINESSYVLACGDGEEEHIAGLARSLDRRVANLVSSVGQVGEARLLLMASLMMADELWEATYQLEHLQAQQGTTDRTDVDETLITDLGMLADRIESIAARLKET